MKSATIHDKRLVIEILSESFAENKSVLSVVGNDKGKIPKLMDYSFEKGINEGEVWINNRRNATLIALHPNSAKISIRSMLLDIKLLFSVIGPTRLFKILKREKAIKARQPKANFIHLWYIGVLNKHQNKGEGSKMLADFLDLKKVENIPIYLETSTLRNLNFYRKMGFELVAEISDELPYTLYIFAKNPN